MDVGIISVQQLFGAPVLTGQQDSGWASGCSSVVRTGVSMTKASSVEVFLGGGGHRF